MTELHRRRSSLRDAGDVGASAADDTERFRERYAISGAAALLAAETAALGSDYQANGYTTVAQADELGRVLELRPGQVLVDVGAGCGWPGLYLSDQDGCAVISVDPVVEGCFVARRRALTDGLTERAWTLRGNAIALPLRSGSVDVVVHSDLLC